MKRIAGTLLGATLALVWFGGWTLLAVGATVLGLLESEPAPTER